MTQTQWLLIGLASGLLFVGGKKVNDLTKASENEKKFAPLIAATEKKYGIPTGLLHRLIKQESAFKTAVINGTQKSSAGALGIAQFMPKTAIEELGSVQAALNPVIAIDGAGRYLKKQLAWTKNRGWLDAVAAYNWGAGNVNKFRAGKIKTMPLETQKYIAAIVA